MLKILIKAFILVCIILSIYFIVNPSACSNLVNGRVVNTPAPAPVALPQDNNHQELLTPAGDQPLQLQPAQPQPVTQPAPAVTPAQPAAATEQPLPSAAPAQPAAVTDTNSAQPGNAVYTQAQTDYAIAARYVELENEYKTKKKDTKNAAQEISYIVMDDFEMTPSEWEAFLQRATVSNLFEQVRARQAAK